MNFTDDEQQEFREAFIKEARLKSWGAACNADLIAKQLDDVMAEYGKLKTEDDQLAADIKDAEQALDHHTVDNRNARKEKQERRNQIAKVLEALAQNMARGQKALESLQASVESNMALAQHAEGWEWKDTPPISKDDLPLH